jgi:hypothetical protein
VKDPVEIEMSRVMETLVEDTHRLGSLIRAIRRIGEEDAVIERDREAMEAQRWTRDS